MQVYVLLCCLSSCLVTYFNHSPNKYSPVWFDKDTFFYYTLGTIKGQGRQWTNVKITI